MYLALVKKIIMMMTEFTFQNGSSCLFLLHFCFFYMYIFVPALSNQQLLHNIRLHAQKNKFDRSHCPPVDGLEGKKNNIVPHGREAFPVI